MQLVGPDHLPNAIALNSTGFNAARVVGPAIGGLLVAAVGEGICFLLNALSYVAVLISLFFIRAREPVTADAAVRGRGATALRDGFVYARRRPEVARILALVGVVSAVAVPYRSFLPAMARGVLDVGAWRYGLLMAAAGVGAGSGGLVLAGLKVTRATYRRLLPAALVIFSVSLGGFALAREYYLALALLTCVGIGGILYFNCSNTLVQLSVEDSYRGRVMSFYTLMHQGTATFGSLAIGVIADRWGTPMGLLAGAFLCLLAGVAWVASSNGARALHLEQA
jgi:predicted MFS family arabinose efflux permease